jgi:hypothetical protein
MAWLLLSLPERRLRIAEHVGSEAITRAQSVYRAKETGGRTCAGFVQLKINPPVDNEHGNCLENLSQESRMLQATSYRQECQNEGRRLAGKN